VIADRFFQAALKLVLEPIFKAVSGRGVVRTTRSSKPALAMSPSR
jgi:hypothetical protein